MHIQFMALSMVLLYKEFLRTVKKVYLQHRVSLINVICHLSIIFPKTVVIIWIIHLNIWPWRLPSHFPSCARVRKGQACVIRSCLWRAVISGVSLKLKIVWRLQPNTQTLRTSGVWRQVQLAPVVRLIPEWKFWTLQFYSKSETTFGVSQMQDDHAAQTYNHTWNLDNPQHIPQFISDVITMILSVPTFIYQSKLLLHRSSMPANRSQLTCSTKASWTA